MINFHVYCVFMLFFQGVQTKNPRKKRILRFSQGRKFCSVPPWFLLDFPFTQGVRRRLLLFRRATPEWSSLNLRKETPSKRFSLSVRQWRVTLSFTVFQIFDLIISPDFSAVNLYGEKTLFLCCYSSISFFWFMLNPMSLLSTPSL